MGIWSCGTGLLNQFLLVSGNDLFNCISTRTNVQYVIAERIGRSKIIAWLCHHNPVGYPFFRSIFYTIGIVIFIHIASDYITGEESQQMLQNKEGFCPEES